MRNIEGGGHANGVRYRLYLEFAAKAIQALRLQIASEDLESLITTRGYWQLQQFASNPDSTVASYLVDAEIRGRIEALGEAKKDLDFWRKAFDAFGAIAIPDSSFYINHPTKLREWDLAPDVGVRAEGICIVAPIAVVDELDDLKRHHDRQVRWRAGHSLGVMSQVLAGRELRGRLKEADPVPTAGSSARGEVWLRVVFDPPGHIRLPLADDEIIDRTLALQAITGREVAFLTYDNGQDYRARAAGLESKKFDTEEERGAADGSIQEPASK